jgi:RNA polymerase sigma factor (sigma-70 family)
MSLSQPSPPLSEEQIQQLLGQARNGDADAAYALFQHCSANIRKKIHRKLGPTDELRRLYDTDDFLQETAIHACLQNVPADVCDSIARFQAYLVWVVLDKVQKSRRNHLVYGKHNLRREKPVANLGFAEANQQNGHPCPRNLVVRAENWEELVEGLPQRSQEVLRLRLDGYTEEQIARALRVTERTVRRILKEIRETL